MNVFRVCSDCKVHLLGQGGHPNVELGIELGQTCEIHPTQFPPQASSVVEAPAVFDPPPPPPAFAETEPFELPTTIGPLTEISARLVVAWSTESNVADPPLIASAVQAARTLLSYTKGE